MRFIAKDDVIPEEKKHDHYVKDFSFHSESSFHMFSLGKQYISQ